MQRLARVDPFRVPRKSALQSAISAIDAVEAAAAASDGGLCPVVLRVDSLPEAPESGLVDSRGRFDGGPRYISRHEPLDDSHLPLQLTLLAAFLAALLTALLAA